jgi:hypothetical protein
VLSVLFTISCLGLGLPAVAAGFAVAKGGRLVTTSYVYGVSVIFLAALATLNLIRLRTDNRALTADQSTALRLGTQPATRLRGSKLGARRLRGDRIRDGRMM